MTPESGSKVLRNVEHENSGYDKRLIAWTQSVVQKMSPSEHSKVGYLGQKIGFFQFFSVFWLQKPKIFQFFPQNQIKQEPYTWFRVIRGYGDLLEPSGTHQNTLK